MHTLKIYIKPETEKVNLSNTVILEGDQVEFSVIGKLVDHEAANDAFFAEEDIDDEYDPFFDE